MKRYTLWLGDCLERMKELEDNSVDSVVTDPPSGIAFMNQAWDDMGTLQGFQDFIYSAFQQVYRVLKPGGHCLVWALPRTSHHTAMGLERAGFEIREKVYHCFSSGFPKSLNISKSIDRLKGVKREVLGYESRVLNRQDTKGWKKSLTTTKEGPFERRSGCLREITAPVSDEAKQYDGWGTALKPSIEEWILCRKPLSEKNVALNVLKHGTGGLNIDGCRVPVNQKADASQLRTMKRSKKLEKNGWGMNQNDADMPVVVRPEGRWPAQVIHDGSEEVVSLFPQFTKSGAMKKDVLAYDGKSTVTFIRGRSGPSNQHGDSGSASRFFYCAKPSKRERNAGLNDMPEQTRGDGSGKTPKTRNFHPTLKPLALMRYLCRLVTPKDGIVLDPFMGSGTTGIAAIQEGFRFVGIEKESAYYKIAVQRVKHAIKEQSKQMKSPFEAP